MPSSTGHPRLLATAARWPAGLLLTWWAYIWRITPLHRREVPGAMPEDGPPALPAAVSLEDVQRPEDGHGAFLRRRYRVDVAGAQLGAAQLIARVREDPNAVVPGGLAQIGRAHV